jgi:hypothetical protein
MPQACINKQVSSMTKNLLMSLAARTYVYLQVQQNARLARRFAHYAGREFGWMTEISPF